MTGGSESVGIVMPRRRWAHSVSPAPPQPTVLVSSRDGAEVPRVAGAARLVAAAEAAGWTARQTYALADVPATARRAAHRRASVAVRLRAPDGRPGWAVWHRIDDGAWRFSSAFLGMENLGAKALLERVTANG